MASHNQPAHDRYNSSAFIDELSKPTPAMEWLLSVGDLARRLNEESLGDCLSGTVAGAPSGLSRDASQAKPLIDYRKENHRGD